MRWLMGVSGKITSSGPIDVKIPGFVYDHNILHDIHRDCNAEEHDQDGDNDDSKT